MTDIFNYIYEQQKEKGNYLAVKVYLFVEAISDNPWKRWIVKAANITFTGNR